LYIQATIEIDDIGFPAFKEDFEEREAVLDNYNDDIMEILGEADYEKYIFFINSFGVRILINEFNNDLDNENHLDDDQLDILTHAFYNISRKYYEYKYFAGAGAQQTTKWEGNQTCEEIDAIIENEYIDFAENVVTKTQLEALKSILNRH
jgi:hypothetical protein